MAQNKEKSYKYSKKLADRVRELRGTLTQQAFADKVAAVLPLKKNGDVQFSLSLVQSIEQCQRAISKKSAYAIAAAYKDIGLRPEYLLDEDDPYKTYSDYNRATMAREILAWSRIRTLKHDSVLSELRTSFIEFILLEMLQCSEYSQYRDTSGNIGYEVHKDGVVIDLTPDTISRIVNEITEITAFQINRIIDREKPGKKPDTDDVIKAKVTAEIKTGLTES